MDKTKVPCLVPCKNFKKHWKIIFPDGSVSNKFFLYEDGIEILRSAHIEGKMTAEECCKIRDSMFFSKVLRLDDMRKGIIEDLIVENDFLNFIKKEFEKYKENLDFYKN